MKVYGKASIVLLIGTSSVGKSTIVKELKRQDEGLDSKSRLEWRIDGLDAECRRHISEVELCLQIVRDDNLFKQLQDFEEVSELKKLDNISDDERILVDLFYNRIITKSGESISIKDVCLDCFTEDITPYRASKYTRRVVEILKILRIKYEHEFSEAIKKILPLSEIMTNIYQRAVNNSIEGFPTILDIAPLEGYNVVSEFFNYIKECNFSCPVVVAIAHCSVPNIVKRLESRNSSGIPKEFRDGFFPIGAYGNMFKITRDTDHRSHEVIKIHDIIDAANRYGENRGSVLCIEDEYDAYKLCEALEVPIDTENHRELQLTTIFYHDMFFRTDDNNLIGSNPNTGHYFGSYATYSIAKKINSIATRESTVPIKTHPIAKTLRKTSIQDKQSFNIIE